MNGAHPQSMDARSQEYSQPDQASAAQYQQDVKFGQDSARSGSFPEYIQQQPRSYQDGAQRYQQAQPHPGHAAMAQSNPSIATSSPQYAPHQQYSPYPPQHEMHAYPQQPGAPMYAPRPEWAGHYAQPMYHAQVTAPGGAPGMVAQVPRPPGGGHPLSTVYSFVPIPGAQQHKRPRRRYEEIERMYKCGWQGCEKAYGTLNHLNAHVTMQSHGQKRTPEEFKEIRKEWKAKKKEEENQRKAEEERQRQEHANRQQDGTPTQAAAQYPPQHMMPPAMSGTQLPPIGYAPAAAPPPSQYPPQQQPVDGSQQYSAGQMYANGYPQSPYAAQGGQMYQQRQ
ncbi:hypothetical protein AAFC00_006000 [Neodothiora populina]